MSKIQKIKQAMTKASDNDATRAINYLLWYIESLEKDRHELWRAYRSIASDFPGATEDNFSNQISNNRQMVDQNNQTIEEYFKWLKRAEEIDKYIEVAGVKELRYPKKP
jgi:hypothetical protein